MESKEQNKQTKLKQTHKYRELTNGCQRGGEGLGELVERGERIKENKLVVSK